MCSTIMKRANCHGPIANENKMISKNELSPENFKTHRKLFAHFVLLSKFVSNETVDLAIFELDIGFLPKPFYLVEIC